MDLGMIFRTVFEVAIIVFTLWAVFHEDRFAALEQRLFARIRRRKLRVLEGNRCACNNYPVRDR